MADWQKGDLALRVKIGTPCPDCGTPPTTFAGRVYTVEAVVPDECEFYLVMQGIPEIYEGCVGEAYHLGQDPQNFRKVTPDAADAFDREVIEAMSPTPELTGKLVLTKEGES